MVNKRHILTYRLILTFLAFLGVFLEIVKYGIGMLMYYTVLSNLLVLVFIIYLLRLMLTQGEEAWDSQRTLRLKATVTMAIMITCVIYHFMLAPIAEDFWRLENLLCHYIVPLMLLADTLFLDKPKQYRWFDPLLWSLLPLVYSVFALLNGLVLKLPVPESKDSPFPYFFVNVTKYGWPYVGRMIVIICVAYILGGYLLYGIKRLPLVKPFKRLTQV